MNLARRGLRLPSAVLLASAVSTGFSTEVYADSAVADALFTEGKRLMKEEKFSLACDKFEASYQAEAVLGALMNLANCLERDGRPASAFGRWSDAVELAIRANDDRVEYARERREALRPTLSFITLVANGEQPDWQIFLGNSKIGRGALSTALPTNPGTATVQVVRADQVLWETHVEVAERGSATVNIPIDEIAKANPAPVKKRVDLVEARGRSSGENPDGFWNPQRVLGLSVLGVGVVGAGVGFGMGGVAMQKNGEARDLCTSNYTYCGPGADELISEAKTFASISTWTLIGSAVTGAVGITLFLTSSQGELGERAGVPLRFNVGVNGMSASGQF